MDKELNKQWLSFYNDVITVKLDKMPRNCHEGYIDCCEMNFHGGASAVLKILRREIKNRNRGQILDLVSSIEKEIDDYADRLGKSA